MEGKINIPFLYIRQTCMQRRRQTSEFGGGGAFEGQTHILGGKIEFLKRYCFLPMPLSHDFCPPPRRFVPLSKGGDIPRYTAPGLRITYSNIAPPRGANAPGKPPLRIFALHICDVVYSKKFVILSSY